MHLIDKEDYISLTLYLINESLYTALELTSELSSCNEGSQVKEVDFLVSEVERNISLIYPLSDTLCYSGLADTGFTDKAWIVLLSSGEYLDNSCYLLVSADDIVELTVSGFL